MQKLDPSLKICCHFEEYSKVICIPRLCNHPPTHHQICDHVHTWWSTDTRQGSCTTCSCSQYAGHLAGVINTNYISLLIAYNRQRRGVVMFQLFIQHYSLSIQNTDQAFCRLIFLFILILVLQAKNHYALNTLALVSILKIKTIQYPSCCIVTLLLIIMSADYN